MSLQVEGNGVDLKKTPFIMAPKLIYDRKKECFVGKKAKKANALLNTPYRKGFEIPEKV